MIDVADIAHDPPSSEHTPAPPLESTPAQSVMPSSSATTSTTIPSTPRPQLTQAMIIKMGHLAHSADVRASRVEAAIPDLIEKAIASALAPILAELAEHRLRIDEYGLSLASLTSRVEECEKRGGNTEELKAMKANIAVLQTEMDSLKSTDINMLWGTIEVDDPYAESIPTAS